MWSALMWGLISQPFGVANSVVLDAASLSDEPDL